VRWSRTSRRDTAAVKLTLGASYLQILVVATRDSIEASCVPLSGTFSVRNSVSALDFGNTILRKYLDSDLGETKSLAAVARAVVAT